jgi:hypothetical protein
MFNSPIIYNWTIKNLYAENERITSAHYHVVASVDDLSVETEGNWFFDEPGTVPFASVTEEMVVGWIESSSIRDGKCVIKSRLEEQLKALEIRKPVVAPWMPQVFTPDL